MRILFSITYYTPYSSGLTLYVKRLAEKLSKRGIDSTVLCMRHNKNLPVKETINSVRVIRVKPLFAISKGFISYDLIVKSFKLVVHNQVVILNLPQFEAIIPAVIAKLYRKKVISIYHCEVIMPKGILNSVIQWCLSGSNFLSLLLSDKVITYTKDFVDSSWLLAPFKGKIKNIYPPIHSSGVNRQVQTNIKKKIGTGNDFVIGVAARLAAEKGIEYLLESIPAISSKLPPTLKLRRAGKTHSRLSQDKKSKLKGKIDRENESIFKIVVAGSMEPVGEEHYKQKILKLVEKYKDYVIFLGELKEEEMGSFYSLLDVLVLPSVNSTEAFGMVQVEAMMMGVPVVATDLPGVRIPIRETQMGKIVPKEDSEALSEAIIEVIINKKKYIKERQVIRDKFEINKTVEFYLDLLQKSINEKS